jgi:asparagine synthase (glutamine-hydrolysing)
MLPPGQSRYAAYWVFLKNFTELRRLRGLPLARRMFAPPAPEPALGFLNPEFAARTQVAERQRLHHGRKPQSRRIEGWLHYHVLTGPMQSYAFEILDRTAAAAGVEARYPFWDKRLVEFCLSLDPTEKLDGGWSRLILRRGLEGVLPRKVQWRVGKFDFLSHLTAMMIRHHAGLIADILADKTGLLANYVDLAKLRIAFHALRANPEQANGYLVQFMSRLVVLAFWLRQQQEIRA